MFYAELVQERDGVEITWLVPYDWSRPVRATRIDPAEGGLELDGDPYPVTVTYYPGWAACSAHFTIDNIQEGSILGLLLVEKYGTPLEDDCWDAASDDNNSRLEDPR